MHQLTRLPQGLTVLTAEMPHMASVSCGIWVGVGGRYEPAALSGASHFIEHMLFKGTRKRNTREISQAIEGIGGYLNAFTSEETTCFYSRAHHANFSDLLEVLTDMFLNSIFAPVEMEKERGVILEELAMYQDQPQHLVHDLLNETLWPDQALGRSLTGSVKSLRGLTRDDLLAYFRQHYVASNTVISVAGKIKHSDVVRMVSRKAQKFAPAKAPVFAPALSRQKEPAIRLHTKKTEQTQIVLGFRTCSRHDERRHALRLLNTILGENMSSRLFQSIREEHGLAYSIYSSSCLLDDVGVHTIAAGLDPANLPRALRLIGSELRRLRSQLADRAELRRARDYLIGQIDLSLESPETRMMWMGEQWLTFGKIISPAQIKEHLGSVTASQVRSAARDFFTPDRLSLALVSPLKKERGLIQALQLN